MAFQGPGDIEECPKAKKGATAQRLIADRRRQNAIEKRLRWLELPSAVQLQRIVLEGAEVPLGSGEDLECYYYFLSNGRAWLMRNAVGPLSLGLCTPSQLAVSIVARSNHGSTSTPSRLALAIVA